MNEKEPEKEKPYDPKSVEERWYAAWIAAGSNPALVAGATVWAQYWSRDPGFPAPFNAGLTDAQTFVIWP